MPMISESAVSVSMIRHKVVEFEGGHLLEDHRGLGFALGFALARMTEDSQGRKVCRRSGQ